MINYNNYCKQWNRFNIIMVRLFSNVSTTLIIWVLFAGWWQCPAALRVKPSSSVDEGRKKGGGRVWHGSLAPVFVHRHVHRAAQRGLCIVRHTHIAPLSVDSAGLVVIIPFSCLPSSAAHSFANSHSAVLWFPHVFRCLSPLILAPPSSPLFAVCRRSPG